MSSDIRDDLSEAYRQATKRQPIWDEFQGLSDDAKCVAGGTFGMMQPGKGTVTFHTPSRITPRGKAALDELVEAGVLSCETFNRFGGLVYKPMVLCWPFHLWLGANREKGNFALVSGAKPGDKITMEGPKEQIEALASVPEIGFDPKTIRKAE